MAHSLNNERGELQPYAVILVFQEQTGNGIVAGGG
jgi:hypothetical protein